MKYFPYKLLLSLLSQLLLLLFLAGEKDFNEIAKNCVSSQNIVKSLNGNLLTKTFFLGGFANEDERIHRVLQQSSSRKSTKRHQLGVFSYKVWKVLIDANQQYLDSSFGLSGYFSI